ncbi:unnamed protein product [Rotaria socialis]|uniref:Uncharacterized protein n=1 Tax=Rotaria socialis TaxID=392032 RepID=A0A817VL11_9BILA|nr:unnamed protein product [Rotaria socialis]CAF3403402.1 unnamed protein product [Rotaria socialis]CAF4668124.1 unnamed protein product [Rotaria socialis]CAF4936780.1 unnamed protein product [Rotaria socialis]
MGGKLQPHYYGPCRLIKQLSPNTFTVCRLSDNVNVGATNTDRIKPYIELNRNNRGTTTTTKDQSAQEKQTETLINNQEARLSDLYLRNVKRNQPPTGNNSSQRRASDRQRRVSMRYIEN